MASFCKSVPLLRAHANYTIHYSNGPSTDDDTPNMFHTCEHPYHSKYNSTHLPPLLFRLEAPEEPSIRPAVLHLMDDDAAPSSKGSNAVRDFPFLPRYISIRVPGWLLEYWMRTDSRLTYRDIKARMTAPPADIPSDNALNMRREREARSPLGLSCWTTRRGGITKAEVERVERLSQSQISFNTTTAIEYASGANGKKFPLHLLMKRLDGGPSQRYPLDTFMDGKKGPHLPGQRLESTIQLLCQLQDYANALGEDDWRSLAPEYLPETWAKRAANRLRRQAEKATESEENLTHAAPSGNTETNVDKVMEKKESDTYCAKGEVKETGADGSEDKPLPKSDSPGGRNISQKSSISPNKNGPLPQTPSLRSESVGSSAQSQKSRYTNPFVKSQLVLSCDTQDLLEDCDGICCRPLASQESRPTLSSHSELEDSPRKTPDIASLSDGDSDDNQDSDSEPLSDLGLLPQRGSPLSAAFNGGGTYSIRNNPHHRLNTHTAEMTRRNDPFANYLHLLSGISNPPTTI
ncbi:hypothetical protein H112_04297 [Trichophyton rubrum D6]|uniref:Uncharacterized protein n=2 Tax=Trichophyton TaxID=5550 RepID=F2SPS5_TRIRC|nr:uncharacterized protein TERG_04074 [Trichophyton rubrum CBS 118892]EZF22794.1 hypothetical protein H100_04305 [Trichophyton rubrum MR850]EZF63251.1 hypothetical protein H104_04287 [Trichophyton rubrum CBS 289.86]EZF73984.1 hypothetical protein H105_04314 [Trichophyton soudanense CBS 452.61]EZF84586.1 hypothetical protein H110_04292 [Trichophyton rubrum MR1448]EZF95269.1 hypothetical protein H113_04332 [Trichophyton rubrum MR1459]EZG06342.1 hypothetical protein H106_04116 [Trichophyton rubr